MSGSPSQYTKTVRRPDPRLPESWCREGAMHDHDACGDLWDSASRRDTLEAVHWADEQREPWRFDVPEVPAHVTCVKWPTGAMWARIDANTWGSLWQHPDEGWWAITDRRVSTTYLLSASLVECEDPRKEKS